MGDEDEDLEKLGTDSESTIVVVLLLLLSSKRVLHDRNSRIQSDCCSVGC